MPTHLRWMLVLAGLLTVGTAADAQVRASERGGVFQQVNGTTITIEYGRPSVRSRGEIYGGQIPWGTVWTAGANWATTLETTHDLTIDGRTLPHGKYSVWMEVQPGAWTVILDPRARMFHTARPKPDSAQFRFSVVPTTVQGPDLLTWSFSEMSASGTTIQMAWAGKAISFRAGVPAVEVPKVAATTAARYTGRYTLWWRSESNKSELVVTASDEQLRGKWTGAPFPEWTDLRFVQIAPEWFQLGALLDGALYDVVTDVVFEFAVADGHATGFEIRGPGDLVFGRGTLVR